MKVNEAAPATCPVHAPTIPYDGTPFRPSPSFSEWRAEAPATRVTAEDGNVGWFVTAYELARTVLGDPRFSAAHPRYPVGHGHLFDSGAEPGPEEIEALAAGDLLSLDPPQHSKIRRSVTGRLSVRSVRGRLPLIREYVEQRLDALLAAGNSAELFTELAVPVSVFAHCLVLGIPDTHRARFADIFAAEPLRSDDMFSFAQEVVRIKEETPGEDTISDLLDSDLTRHEIEGITVVLMRSGRDAIAYMISTNTATLLMNPRQLAELRRDPATIAVAVEEFVRFNAMFVSTHPRTVTEDVDIDGIPFRAGESVWTSTVAANRDPDRFDDPETFDVTRDAFGHVAFGHGVHACIGQQLARLVIAETIGQLLHRMPGLHLIDAEQAHPMPFAGQLPTYSPGRVRVGW